MRLKITSHADCIHMLWFTVCGENKVSECDGTLQSTLNSIYIPFYSLVCYSYESKFIIFSCLTFFLVPSCSGLGVFRGRPVCWWKHHVWGGLWDSLHQQPWFNSQQPSGAPVTVPLRQLLFLLWHVFLCLSVADSLLLLLHVLPGSPVQALQPGPPQHRVPVRLRPHLAGARTSQRVQRGVVARIRPGARWAMDKAQGYEGKKLSRTVFTHGSRKTKLKGDEWNFRIYFGVRRSISCCLRGSHLLLQNAIFIKVTTSCPTFTVRTAFVLA